MTANAIHTDHTSNKQQGRPDAAHRGRRQGRPDAVLRGAPRCIPISVDTILGYTVMYYRLPCFKLYYTILHYKCLTYYVTLCPDAVLRGAPSAIATPSARCLMMHIIVALIIWILMIVNHCKSYSVIVIILVTCVCPPAVRWHDPLRCTQGGTTCLTPLV